eukprot:Selendium_serpulae@DN11889_c0_g1_i1.p1
MSAIKLTLSFTVLWVALYLVYLVVIAIGSTSRHQHPRQVASQTNEVGFKPARGLQRRNNNSVPALPQRHAQRGPKREENNNSVPLQYTPPPAANVTDVGAPFDVDPELLKTMGLPFNNFVDINEESVKDFVIVMGVSSNHYRESIDAVASAQH